MTKHVFVPVISSMVVAAAVAWFVAQSALSSAHPASSTEGDGRDSAMNMTEGEYLSLMLTLRCLENGGLCSAFVSEWEGKPYIFITIEKSRELSDEKATMRALMACYQECRRFSWADEVVLEKVATDGSYRIARVSLAAGDPITPYEKVYENIAWLQRAEQFLPTAPGHGLEALPLSKPWQSQ